MYVRTFVVASKRVNFFADIDQWNKVTQVLGTPPPEFFKRLQPSVSYCFTCIL